MIGYMGAWSPPSSVTDHNGDPLPSDANFFAAPPQEIGEVVTATTSLRAGQSARSTGGRVGIAVAFGVLGGLLGYAIAQLEGAEAYGDALIGGGFLLAALIAFLVAGKKPTCSFVGKEGVARFTMNDDPAKGKEVFLFRDAAELRTHQIRMYHNGIYTGTEYDYKWQDPEGKNRFRLKGNYYGYKKPPKPKSPFWLAEAAEAAWSAHYLARAKEEQAKNGWARFNLSGANSVYIGRDFIEFQLKGKTERLHAEEIERFGINQGVVTFGRRGAKSGFLGFGKEGFFSFEYQNLANARVFLIMLGELAQSEDSVTT
jgi:hypothetical protein